MHPTHKQEKGNDQQDKFMHAYNRKCATHNVDAGCIAVAFSPVIWDLDEGLAALHSRNCFAAGGIEAEADSKQQKQFHILHHLLSSSATCSRSSNCQIFAGVKHKMIVADQVK